ncbi:MAG TPA: GntR family transcriptional regulator [Bordetella sp.]
MQPRLKAPDTTHTPMYLRIRNAIRDAITQGAYKPGDLLPSETELAKRYGTTRATVVHAMQQLVFEGLIDRRRGLGSFVAPSALGTVVDTRQIGYFERDIHASGQNLTYEVVGFGKAPVDDQIRNALRLDAKEPVFRLQRLRIVHAAPIAFEMRYMPALIGTQLTHDQLVHHPVQDLLEQHVGLHIQQYENTIRVALPPASVAKHLKIDRGRPVLVRAYTWLDARGIPLLWGETLYREEYQIHYMLESK